MNLAVYEPSTTLSARIKRHVTPYFSRKPLNFKLDKPIISFTFDDVPVSALTHALPALENKNWRSTLYVAAGLFGTTNHHGKMADAHDIRAAFKSGHEIGGHSYSHTDMSNMLVEATIEEISRNHEELMSYAIPQPRSFAYPYGEVSPNLKAMLSVYFEALRGIHPGAHRRFVDLNQIKSVPIFSNRGVDDVVSRIRKLKKEPAWMTLFTHDVRGGPSLWGCTPEDFARIIETVESIDAQVLPVIEAVDYLRTVKCP